MSDMVRDWYGEWKSHHVEVVQRHDWPAVGSDFWDPLFREMIAAKATREDAYDATARLALDAPKYLNEQIPAVIAHVKAAIAKRAALGSDDGEQAKAASHDCPNCGGSGVAVRHRHRSARVKKNGEVNDSDCVELACTCPFGRWGRAKRAQAKLPAALDLADYPWLQVGPVEWSIRWDNRFCWIVSAWDEANDRPRPEHLDRMVSKGECPDAFARRWSTARGIAATPPPAPPAAPPSPYRPHVAAPAEFAPF